jgi:hypothetical protein
LEADKQFMVTVLVTGKHRQIQQMLALKPSYCTAMSESGLTGFKDLQDENSINKIYIPDFFRKSGILLLLIN